MQRKVIQQGPCTMMVSLPSKWVKLNCIKKGDDLTVDFVNNQLVVCANDITEKKKARLHIKKNEVYLDRLIMIKYRDGYDEILVKYDDPQVFTRITETLRYLLGFEVIDQTADSCLIKNVSGGSDADYPTMFRRMFQIVVTMSESCHDFITTGDKKHLKTAVDLRETLVKLEQFNLRIVSKKNSYSLDKKSFEFFYVWNVATFGKMWSSLARKPLSRNPKLTSKEKKFFTAVVAYTRDFYGVFYSRDAEKFRSMKNRLYKLRPVGAKLLNTSRYPLIFFYLLRLVNRMYEVTLAFDA